MLHIALLQMFAFKQQDKSIVIRAYSNNYQLIGLGRLMDEKAQRSLLLSENLFVLVHSS